MADDILKWICELACATRKGQENRTDGVRRHHISAERRLLTRRSGRVSVRPCMTIRARRPNVSGVPRVGDRRMKSRRANPEEDLLSAFENVSWFARLRGSMQMTMDVGRRVMLAPPSGRSPVQVSW